METISNNLTAASMAQVPQNDGNFMRMHSTESTTSNPESNLPTNIIPDASILNDLQPRTLKPRLPYTLEEYRQAILFLMPNIRVLDGIDVTAEVRLIPSCQDMPDYLITGFRNEELHRKLVKMFARKFF